MITSEDVDLSRVLYLEGEKETDSLNSLSSSINIVPQKQIVGLRRKAAVLKESEHVIVLSMNISAYFDRGINFD